MEATTGSGSTPSFFEFNPKLIPYQYRVIYDARLRYDYSLGVHYVLLSGSIGSAKSTLMAWMIIDHCTRYNNARALIGRKSLPDLKDTIFLKILEMLEGDFIEGVDYEINLTKTSIKFANGSEIISRSWHDRKFKKFRSLELSMIVIEELTENDARDWAFFTELMGRIGRLPHIKENIFICATNPDDPSHVAHDFFIKDAQFNKRHDYCVKDGNIHTYFSVTSQNPFLPTWYIEQLKKKYDPKMCRRMLFGEWLYISTDVIYHQYDPEKHVAPEQLLVKENLPIRITFDFNIQKGKPMSSALLQFDKDASNVHFKDRTFTFLDEVAVEGARTESVMEEWASKGWLDLPHNPEIIVHGDATGSHGTSKSIYSDYEIIEKFLANYRRKDKKQINYDIRVTKSNPSLRDRHNVANGQLCNANKVVAVVINNKCSTIKDGFANTRLKEGASYLEDQTTKGQDISTACTYAMYYCVEYELFDEDEIDFE